MPSCVSRESIDQQEFVRAQTPDLLVHHLNHIDPAPKRDNTSPPRSYLISRIRTRGRRRRVRAVWPSPAGRTRPRAATPAAGHDHARDGHVSADGDAGEEQDFEDRGSRIEIGNLGLRIADLREQVGFVHQAEAAQGFVKVYRFRQVAVEIDHLREGSVVEFAGRRVERIVQPFDQCRE